MTPEKYHFGSALARRLDFYSFPRTGSHYLFTCLTGLLDLVYFPNEFTDQLEPRQRAEELNPYTFYVLRMRDAGVPHQPVYINPQPNGTHGTPRPGDWPVLLLIRDPHPTIHSWYRTAIERWGEQVPDRRAWIAQAYGKYAAFYTAGLALAASDPERTFLLRYEDLLRTPITLAHLVRFIGVRPKLDPEFVHWWTHIERMTKPGPRTFFRVGNNEAWRGDAEWLADVRAAGIAGFPEFGYPSPP